MAVISTASTAHTADWVRHTFAGESGNGATSWTGDYMYIARGKLGGLTAYEAAINERPYDEILDDNYGGAVKVIGSVWRDGAWRELDAVVGMVTAKCTDPPGTCSQWASGGRREFDAYLDPNLRFRNLYIVVCNWGLSGAIGTCGPTRAKN
ncbi:hypothetical protein ACWCQW_45265 [Streptomyces mirabilis]